MAYKRNRFGSIVLTDENGNEFTITKKEQQELKTYTKRANQRRLDKSKRYYDTIKNQANMKGISYESYMDLMEKRGFITERYKTDLKQFKSKDEFKDMMKELKTVTKRGYGENHIEDIRQSMLKRVQEDYGKSQTKGLRDTIKNLSRAELLSLYLHNDDIVKTLYGSGDDDNVEELLTKTESDINYFLTKTKNNTTKGKGRKKGRK